MGLLDDAIREHLELKRRHGADPDEVARQETEALGETRRAEFARPEGAEPADAPASAEPEPAAVPDDFPVPEFDAGRERAPEPDDRDDEVVAPTAEHEVDEPPARHEPFDVEADAPAEPPVAAVEPPAATAPPAATEPPATTEPAKPSEPDDPWLDEDRDEVPADEALDHPRGDEADEDVLEETPDFLQETPEHDRLWFEQRPPRDFDWDK